jgi:hypothetical protein
MARAAWFSFAAEIPWLVESIDDPAAVFFNA